MTNGPVFIVGTSRSGTTMIRGCLNEHPDLYVANETHFFDDLRPRLRGRENIALTPADSAACEDYFLSLAHGVYGVAEARRWKRDVERPDALLTRDELRSTAAGLGAGTDPYFEAFCRLQATKRARSRWGEKTPRHVFRIREILDRYPDGQVICMVRDPRAVAASYRKFDKAPRPGHGWFLWKERLSAGEEVRIRRSYHALIVSILWRAAAKAALEASKEFGAERVCVQRFEEVAVEPARVVRRLCDWLGLDYRDEMVSTTRATNSSFAGTGQAAAVSAEPVNRWRESLSLGDLGVIQATCGSLMREFGYEPQPVGPQFAAITWAWLSLPFAALRAYAANRYRIAGASTYVGRRLNLAFRAARR